MWPCVTLAHWDPTGPTAWWCGTIASKVRAIAPGKDMDPSHGMFELIQLTALRPWQADASRMIYTEQNERCMRCVGNRTHHTSSYSISVTVKLACCTWCPGRPKSCWCTERKWRSPSLGWNEQFLRTKCRAGIHGILCSPAFSCTLACSASTSLPLESSPCQKNGNM